MLRGMSLQGVGCQSWGAVRRALRGVLASGLLLACAEPQPRSRAPRIVPRPLAEARATQPTLAQRCAELEPLFVPLLQGQWVASASMAWISAGHSSLCSFGRARGDAAATPDALYEIGSLSKLFTGVLLASQVRQGHVALEDPVNALLPASAQLAVNGRAVTLLDLATHRSGLPRMPDDFTPANPADPYVDYGEKRLFDFISRATPAKAGAQYVYSNLGAALLGQALAHHEGLPYAALLQRAVLEPLAMRSTSTSVPPDSTALTCVGHDADGAIRPAWHFDSFAPAAALSSSARDMARFLSAALVPSSSPLGPALKLAERPRAEAGAGRRIGLFFQTRADGSLWHNGQTGGFASYLALDPTRNVGVVLLLSSAFARSDELGDRVLAFALGQPLVPLTLPANCELDSERAHAYEGEYALSSAFSVRVFLSAGKLYVQATAQSPFRLWCSAQDRFYLRGVEARLEFERDATGRPQTLILDQGGARQRAVRR